MDAPAAAFTNVTVLRGRRPVLHHLSFELPAGAFVGILGPNGAGKTTMLETMLGWHRLATGGIQVAGQPGGRRSQRLSYLAQRHGVDLDFPMTVEDLVAMGRFQQLGPFRRFRDEDHAAVEAAIAELGLQGVRTRPLSRLSGGQVQRAFLGRALATGADIFLLDEPLAGLDAPTSQDLLRCLGGWGALGRSVLAVIHDLPAAMAACSHILLIDNHLIACGRTAEVCTAGNIARTFGRSDIPLPAEGGTVRR